MERLESFDRLDPRDKQKQPVFTELDELFDKQRSVFDNDFLEQFNKTENENS